MEMEERLELGYTQMLWYAWGREDALSPNDHPVDVWKLAKEYESVLMEWYEEKRYMLPPIRDVYEKAKKEASK